MAYDKLDAAILKAIANGTRRFYLITAAVDSLASPHASQLGETFRVVDRRLQTLRKRGRIIFRQKEWFLD